MASRSEPPGGAPLEERPNGSSSQRSYGNMSEHHWSKTRGERNREAIDYYRERSRAPGVEEGGGPRTSTAWTATGSSPTTRGSARARTVARSSTARSGGTSTGWEIDRPPASDLRALLPWMVLVAALLAAGAWGLSRI